MFKYKRRKNRYSDKESHSESEFYYPEDTENNEIYDENEFF